ncbi:hypothetical protein EE612_051545, partial [Oryza sativa]
GRRRGVPRAPVRPRGAVAGLQGMEAPVFSALLRFVYTDALPEMKEGSEEKLSSIFPRFAPSYGRLSDL